MLEAHFLEGHFGAGLMKSVAIYVMCQLDSKNVKRIMSETNL